MTITNNWAVTQMDCYPEYDSETDVVFVVHWTLTAMDDEGHTGYVYGAQGLTLDGSAPFTPYANLTQEQVLGWVFAAMGPEQVAAYEAAVAQQIQNEIDPPVVTPPLPWMHADG